MRCLHGPVHRFVHRYGPGRDQHGELWLPDGDGPHPVAVVIHGGFWKARYRKSLMDPLCADLAGAGWAAWNVEYRRVGFGGGGGGWPRTGEDVLAAHDALAVLAARHPLDLGRVCAVGHSAGGHLALWLAAERQVPAVALAAVSDLALASSLGLGGGAVDRLLGGRPDAVPTRLAHASPTARVPLGVAQLLVHGLDDRVVPPALSERHAAMASAAGDDVTLDLVSGTDHMAVIDPASEAWERVRRWLSARRWDGEA